jgi:hypothetical protein
MMTINQRSLQIGFIGSILFVVLKLLNSFYEYEMSLEKTFDLTKQLIFTITHFYLYISILFLLKKVLVDYYKQETLRTNLNWIIYLNGLVAASSILMVLGLGKYLAAITPVLIIAELIFYFRFFSGVMLIKEEAVPAISQLQNFVKAFLVTMAIWILFSVFMKLNDKPDFRFLTQLFLAIPFVFMSTFFYKTGKAIYKEDSFTPKI